MNALELPADFTCDSVASARKYINEKMHVVENNQVAALALRHVKGMLKQTLQWKELPTIKGNLHRIPEMQLWNERDFILWHTATFEPMERMKTAILFNEADTDHNGTLSF